MKILVFLFFCFPFLSLAEEIYTLKKADGCYVKSYVDKKFIDVDYKKFFGMKINANPHKKNANYMIFRVEKQIYVTKSKCLRKIDDYESMDETLSTENEEDYSYLNKPHSYQIENLQFNDHKWMIELDGGITSFASRNPIFNNYSDLNGIEDDNGNVYTFSTVEKSKYSGGTLISLSAGYRISEISFLTLKYKSYTGKKTDTVNATKNGTPGYVDMDFKDKFSSILFGNKFIFLPNSHLKPTLGIYGGISTIKSDAFNDSLKFESYGFSGQVDLGLEYFFTNHFAFGINYGIELLGTRTFRLVEKEDSVSDKGFKTKMNYTNTFATAGLKFYF